MNLKFSLFSCLLLTAGITLTGCQKQTAEVKPQIPILAWYSIPPGPDQTLENYETLRDCGFTYTFSHTHTYEDALQVLDLSAKVGIKSVLMCDSLYDAPEIIVRRVMNHPGLGAYFLRDEPRNDELDNLGRWARQIQAIDSVHPCYLNLLPRHAWGSAEEYKEHLRLFDEKVNLPQLSYDHYPIVTSGDTVTLNPLFFENLELFSGEARRVGKPFWAFTLATSHAHYPIPHMGHLRLQLYADLAYGAQCLQYFTYWVPTKDPMFVYHDAPMTQFGKRSTVYEMVRSMNQEIQARAGIFVGCKVDGVYHLGDTIPVGTKRLEQLPPHFRKLDTHGHHALVSLISSGDSHYVLIQNTDPNRFMDFDAEVDDDAYQLVLRDGTLRPASQYSSRFVLEVGDVLIYKQN